MSVKVVVELFVESTFVKEPLELVLRYTKYPATPLEVLGSHAMVTLCCTAAAPVPDNGIVRGDALLAIERVPERGPCVCGSKLTATVTD